MLTRYPHHLARLFSPTKLRAFSRGTTGLVSETYRTAGYDEDLGRCGTFGDAFTAAYEVLCSEYRSEYVFKNTIAQRILLEKHSLDEAVLFSEFRVGTAKIDTVIFNGTSTAYEVKTDLDNLDRLPAQLGAYTQVFDKVYVVTSERGVESVRRVKPDHVGVMALLPDLTFSTVEEAQSNRDAVVPERVIEVMRKSEYSAVIEEAFGSVPDVPNGLFFRECQRLFGELEAGVAHDLMVRALRGRGPSSGKQAAVRLLPPSLMAAGLTYTLSDAEVNTLGDLCACAAVGS